MAVLLPEVGLVVGSGSGGCRGGGGSAGAVSGPTAAVSVAEDMAQSGNIDGSEAAAASKDEVVLVGNRWREGLAERELDAVTQFVSHVNCWRTARGFQALTPNSAVKFLMARKFNVDRAVALYRQHEMMRLREGLVEGQAEIGDETADAGFGDRVLDSELKTGKFTVLSATAPGGAAIAVFNARRHDPSRYVSNRSRGRELKMRSPSSGFRVKIGDSPAIFQNQSQAHASGRDSPT